MRNRSDKYHITYVVEAGRYKAEVTFDEIAIPDDSDFIMDVLHVVAQILQDKANPPNQRHRVKTVAKWHVERAYPCNGVPTDHGE